MAKHFQIYLFGDQTYDVYSKLQDLLHSNKTPIVSSFFKQAFYVLRAQVGQLPAGERESFPRFASIADLLSQKSNRLNPAIDNALTCIYQLGYFMSQHDGIGRPYPSASQICLSGLCTGAISATAISCCKTLTELLPLAIQTVLIAFRTGLCTLNLRQRIDRSNQEWSIVVPTSSPERAVEALKLFSETKHLPLTSQPYVSAYALHGLTISGPPSTLRDLCGSKEFSDFREKHIPIFAPYHAPHLFTDADVESILATTSAEEWTQYSPCIPIISSTTGAFVEATNIRSLFEVALHQVLIEPIRWEQLGQGLAAVLQATETPFFEVTPFATNAEETLYSVLKQVERSSASPLNLPLRFESDSRGEKLTAQKQQFPGALPENSKIAIIGMSGRFPNAENNEDFWDLLSKGLDVHKEVPPLHWDAGTHVDVTGKAKNTSATPYGCWLDNPAAFDARFFNMSPREAPQVDPAQRIALMTAFEAIEQAGIVADATPSTQKERVGVFYGVTSNDWMETNSAQEIDTYFIPGGNRAFIPGRLNYFFKFSGPSYSVDTACSSSLAAIHVACNSLWQGDIDTAIAGGTNVLTNPDFTAGLDRGHFLSRTGNCKTFDDGADGYCRGEGVGTVILKRLDDAIADRDPIQGLIIGAYTNHSAEAQSITRPHIPAQRAIFDKILNGTGVDPYTVSYVEMHGTGTQAGDAGEMTSVLETFAPSTGRQHRRDDQALYLGSAKSNIGHGEAASGITSLAKVLLMMQNNKIPPHCGIKTKINHKFPTDLEQRNVHIAKGIVPWNRTAGQARRVFINNFSAAGGNTALLLEDAPLRTPMVENDPRTSHMVAVSAKSAYSLSGNLKSILAYIESSKESLSLAKLSYTTTARRIHQPHRVMITGSTIQDVMTRLETAIIGGDGMTRATSAPRITFTFTGQGSQFSGMAQQLYSSLPRFRGDISRLDQLGQSLGFPTFEPIFKDESGDDIRKFGPLVVQIASVCLQMAMAKLLASWGIVPESVIGHSLGEYAALNVAGVLSDSDTVFLVGKRAQLLEERCTQHTHSMLVVKAPLSEIAVVLAGKEFEVACLNSPAETVLSGTNENLSLLQATIESHGLKTKVLKVPYAFHSTQVEPVLGDFEVAASGAMFHKPVIPVISSLLGYVITEAGVVGPNYLRRHCREPVNFIGALNFARQYHTITDKSFVLEIGPHPVANGLVKATLGPQINLFPTLQRSKDDWKVLTEALSALYCAGKDILWAEYHRDFKCSHQVLQLPAYSWDLKDYWIQYVHDWSLRKGDPPLLAQPLTSTTVHTVIEDTATSLIVESDISHPDLKPLVQGHSVDNVPLCTPSVYADIALTLGTYILDRYHPEHKERLIDVSSMVIQKALIAKPSGSQPLRTFVTIDWATKSAKCRFVSLDNKGEATVEHSHCSIQFTDRSRVQEIKLTAAKTKSRMAGMRKGLESGKTQRFNRIMVYKMISPLAQFHADYKAIDEVIIDSNTLEASSRVNFKDVKAKGGFHTHPAFLDGLSQSGGFVMNCNDGNDLDNEVFVNHGWKSLQLFEKLSPEKTYSTFVQMFEKDGNMWEGDIDVFDEDTVVASFRGIVLQGVPRRVLHYVLSVEGNRKPNPQRLSKNPSPAATVPAPIVLDTSTNAMPMLISPEKSKFTITIEPAGGNMAKIEQLLQIIAEESGVAVADLTDDCIFADMGVDSLLSLVIVSRFREELGLDMDLESLFTDYPTVKHVKEFFFGDISGDNISTPSSGLSGESRGNQDASTLLSSESTESSDEVKFTPARVVVPATTSVVLQNIPKDTQKTLFLFPDGAGSATSYSGLPKIDAQVAVVGLNSPYHQNPADFKCTFSDLINSYVNEVRRRQPNGPYYFGGWSAGGILAYRASQEMISMGQEVATLILIDSPLPKGLDRLPQHFYDFCNEVHLFGTTTGSQNKPPKWLIPHFNATIDTLHEYYADPLPIGRTPKTSIIWACDTVMDGTDVPKMPPHPDDTEGMKFLTEPRTDFSGNGWEELFPGGEIVLEKLVGANHFTMMRGKHASLLSQLISKAMS